MLSAGTRLGPYEIMSTLGAGGMGEVYRARDTKLGREVAIKVLPEAFASDADRLARFEREAKTLAALNHPHVAQIYGLEDIGAGGRALVMELVDGDDLSQRIAKGPLPVTDALPIAKQIAEALEAAHEQGIIHRDLKPANIKVREDGTVKVLDFGLAKAMERPAEAGRYDGVVTASPTITTPTMTQMGMILGTAAYMSPEQAKGREADKRSDVWAFGCVLYEMLTGKRAFAGPDVSDTLAMVLMKDVDWTALPADTPGSIRQLLRHCLQRDPRQRVRDIGDARLAMDGAFETVSPTAAVPMASALRPWQKPVPLALAAVGLVVVSSLVVWTLTRTTAPAQRLARFVIPSGSEPLAIDNNSPDIAISPDGTRIVYPTGAGQNNYQWHVRAIDNLNATPLPSLPTTAEDPFISADGAWVGFDSTAGTLVKVSILGGPVIKICDVKGGVVRGATWAADDTIVFGTSSPSGLWRVSAGGGQPVEITKAEGGANHLWPEILPGGRAVLFTIVTGAIENAQIAVLDLKTGEQRVLIPAGSYPQYSPTGHIVYGIDGTLRAVGFDLERLAVTTNPFPVVDGVSSKASGAADFGLSRDGTLVYVRGRATEALQRTLVWVDRQGREEPIGAPTRSYGHPRLSPDGTRVALEIRGQNADIWTWDLARRTLTRVTFDQGRDTYPVWTHDGRRLLYSSEEGGAPRTLFWRAADNTGTAERMGQSTTGQLPTSISPDGTRVVFHSNATPSIDLFMLSLDNERKAQPLVQSPSFIERNGEISPDGRWLAYESNDSGRFEVFVRPFPDVSAGRSQVSTGGGTRPLWARSGQELFYADPTGALMSVRVERGSTWTAGNPVKLFEGPYDFLLAGGNAGRTYDVSPDGRRFLMVKPIAGGDQGAAPTRDIVIVQDWTEELKRLVPTR